jgi:hypothetical protein
MLCQTTDNRQCFRQSQKRLRQASADSFHRQLPPNSKHLRQTSADSFRRQLPPNYQKPEWGEGPNNRQHRSIQRRQAEAASNSNTAGQQGG